MCTVQLAHMGLDGEATDGDVEARLREMWQQVEEDPRVVYACGQLERGTLTGNLHGQMYVEFNASLRNTQVRKVLPSIATHMHTTRTKCRDYCRKASDDKSDRVAAMPELGKWRAERGEGTNNEPGPKARALEYVVKDGLEPAEIARIDPECYFTFHHAIKALYRALNEWEGGD